jgi:hypothetical protein
VRASGWKRTLRTLLRRFYTLGVIGAQICEDLFSRNSRTRIVQCLPDSLPEDGVECSFLSVEGSEAGAKDFAYAGVAAGLNTRIDPLLQIAEGDGDGLAGAHGSLVLSLKAVYDYVIHLSL